MATHSNVFIYLFISFDSFVINLGCAATNSPDTGIVFSVYALETIGKCCLLKHHD
jgi:hypothetical protein